MDSIDTLLEQHRALDQRLQELTRHAYLTQQEELEVRQIKKMKLATKDRICDLRNPAGK